MKSILFLVLAIASVLAIHKPLGDSMFMSAEEDTAKSQLKHNSLEHPEKMIGFNSFALPKQQSLTQLSTSASKSIKKFDENLKENKDEVKQEVKEEVKDQTKKDVDRGDGATVYIIITIVFIVIILLLILLCHCGWCGADKALKEKKEKEMMQDEEEKKQMMMEEGMAQEM